MAIFNTKIRYFLQSSNAALHLNSVGTVIFSTLIMKFPGQLEVINLYDTLRFYWGWRTTKSKYQWSQIWKTLFPFMSPNSLQTLENQWLKIATLEACVSSCKCSQRIIAQMSKLTQRKLQGRVPATKETFFLHRENGRQSSEKCWWLVHRDEMFKSLKVLILARTVR